MSALELALAWPVLAAVCVAAVPRSEARLARSVAVIGALIELLMLIRVALAYTPDGPTVQLASSHAWLPSYAIAWTFGLDALALPFVLVLALVTPLALLIGGPPRPGESLRAGVVLLLQASWLGVVAARDLITLVIAWELATVLTVLGLGTRGDGHTALRNTPLENRAMRRYARMALLGGACLLGAVVVLGVARAHATSGLWTWRLDALAHTTLPVSTQALGFVLVLVAVASSLPLLGLQGPLVAICVSGPSSIVALVLGVGMPMGLVLLMRVALPMFPLLAGEWADPLAAVAAVGAVYAGLVAWGERSLGRVLAHLALVHMSLAIIAVLSISADAWVALGPYLLAHALGLTTLTCVSHALRRDGIVDLADLSGWAAAAPWAVTSATIAIALVIGVPGSAGFIGELGIVVGVIERGSPGLLRPIVWIALAAVCLGLAGLGALRNIWQAARGRARPSLTTIVHDLGPGERVAVVAASLFAVVFGLMPQGLLGRVEPDASEQVEELVWSRCLAIEAREQPRPRTREWFLDAAGSVCLDPLARIRLYYGLDERSHAEPHAEPHAAEDQP
jgi:NADH-quinone oxidoreductase subunit M